MYIDWLVGGQHRRFNKLGWWISADLFALANITVHLINDRMCQATNFWYMHTKLPVAHPVNFTATYISALLWIIEIYVFYFDSFVRDTRQNRIYIIEVLEPNWVKIK